MTLIITCLIILGLVFEPTRGITIGLIILAVLWMAYPWFTSLLLVGITTIYFITQRF